MSPVPFHQNRSSEITNRGALPPPLKIKRESHFLKKPPPSQPQPQPQQQREPVIIYTHSPRVIETDAKSFKELVQKLTGFHRSEHQQEEEEEEENQHREEKSSSSSSPPKQINDVAVAVRRSNEEEINNETMMMNSYNCCIGDLKPPPPPPCPPLPSSAIQYPPPDHFLCSNQPLWSYADHRLSSDHPDFQRFRY